MAALRLRSSSLMFGAAMAIRILLIEPQRLLREGFRALLKTQPDFDVVGDGSDSAAALSLAAASSPHVSLIDGTVLAQIERAQLSTLPRIVALEAAPAGRSLLHMVPEPLAGIVCKDDSSDEAFSAIRLIASGGSYVTPRLQHGSDHLHHARCALDGRSGAGGSAQRALAS